MKKYLVIILLSLASIGNVYCQTDEELTWYDLMQSPNPNYYEVKAAYEEFLKDNPDKQSKMFLRWEYWAIRHMDENGNVLTGEDIKQQFLSATSKRNKTDDDKSYWTEVGPILLPDKSTDIPFGIGRINAIAFHPTDSNIFYAGAPSGGLWKTTDGGETWEPLTDHMPTLGVSSIIVHPKHPDTLFMGTGDRDGGDARGLGLYRSYDGGETWHITGLDNGTINRLIINPLDDNIIIAATGGGIYKTTDGGDTWRETTPQVFGNRGFEDIVYNSADTNYVYCTRGPSFYWSKDGGETFERNYDVRVNGSRAAVAVTPANPNYVYVITTTSGRMTCFYRSIDGGFTYDTMAISPSLVSYGPTGTDNLGQAIYDLDIAADPINPDLVYVGGINIWKSLNGGVDWSLTTYYSPYANLDVDLIHEDQHIFEFSPHNNSLYVGNDGGIYRTDDGEKFRFISSGLAVSQCYNIGQSNISRGNLLAGFQDNGTAHYRNGGWRSLASADGFECGFPNGDTQILFGCTQYGNYFRSLDGGDYLVTIKTGINEAGNFSTPFKLSEQEKYTGFAGYKSVWRVKDITVPSPIDVEWEKISDDFNSSFGISIIEVSPANKNVILTHKSGKVYVCKNALAPAAQVVWEGYFAPGFTVNDIEAHPTVDSSFYVIGNRKVHVTNDWGKTWTDLTSNLPKIDINSIVYDRQNPGALYIATDMGVYYYNPVKELWYPFLKNLPFSVEITELEIYYDWQDRSNSVIRASTYGRGIWESPMPDTRLALFQSSQRVLCDNLTVTFEADSFNGATSWYWEFEGGTPATSIQKEVDVTYTSPGKYDVKLIAYEGINNDTVESLDYIEVCNSVSVSTQNANSLQLYPNPARDNFRIDLPGNPQSVKVEMYDVNGRRVRQIYSGPTSSVVVRTDGMAEGVYYVKVYAGNEMLSGKIVIQQ